MRERTMKGAWLAASALCTALLLACAGENAVQTFHAQTRQSEAARPQERGALAGCVIALDAGHGGYDGGAVGRVSGTPEETAPAPWGLTVLAPGCALEEEKQVRPGVMLNKNGEEVSR